MREREGGWLSNDEKGDLEFYSGEFKALVMLLAAFMIHDVRNHPHCIHSNRGLFFLFLIISD